MLKDSVFKLRTKFDSKEDSRLLRYFKCKTKRITFMISCDPKIKSINSRFIINTSDTNPECFKED